MKHYLLGISLVLVSSYAGATPGPGFSVPPTSTEILSEATKILKEGIYAGVNPDNGKDCTVTVRMEKDDQGILQMLYVTYWDPDHLHDSSSLDSTGLFGVGPKSPNIRLLGYFPSNREKIILLHAFDVAIFSMFLCTYFIQIDADFDSSGKMTNIQFQESSATLNSHSEVSKITCKLK